MKSNLLPSIFKEMKLFRIIASVCIVTIISLTACDDTVSTLGSSLIDDNTSIVIDSSFTLSGKSKLNDDVQSRTSSQILGNLTAKEYGYFSSDFVAQFMPALNIDTTGTKITDIDSVRLVMFFTGGNLTGDSIVPMGLKVYPLKKDLPSPIFSNFDPKDYYDEADCWTKNTHIYTGNALYNDSLSNTATRTVAVTLPKQFALNFYQEYLNNPAIFETPQAFTKFFKGIYVKNTFGSGRVINFSETRINLYYKRHATVTKDGVERDTVYNIISTYMAVTPEVVSNNIIDMQISQQLLDRVNAGEPMIIAPAAYDVEMTFPTREIISSYRASAGELSVINTLTMSIPVEKVSNNYNINPPAHVLLVLSKDKKDFFANNKINDDKTSFLASYNEETQSYDFTGMRQYLLDMLSKESITADDYTFTITPVNIVTETSQGSYYQTGSTYVTGINPYVSGPAMCKLSLNNAKIKLTYSKQSIKN